jgi:hypothetical protein
MQEWIYQQNPIAEIIAPLKIYIDTVRHHN